ncbi:hypothetical protein [Vibrio sp. MA40-2]|uniref:hypothetical protein n=1 Tax=Vibrio sp. MA40-2 TaxID=3391828 RepID=UPI0039A715CF
MSTNTIQSLSTRNFIIGELYFAGYDNSDIHQFMESKPLSTRRIQQVIKDDYLSGNLRDNMIQDAHFDGIPIADIHLFMMLPALSLRQIQAITKKAWDEVRS